MSHINDQTYLLNDQYRDSTNLDARVKLHVLFSTNKYGWNRWYFDQLDLPPDARVLELGCGPGYLWRVNLERLSNELGHHVVGFFSRDDRSGAREH